MKAIANPNPVQVIGRASNCLRVLMEAGLTFEVLQKPIDDPKMRERLVDFWLTGGYYPTTSQKLAREIMGQNFLGIEEVIRHFGVSFTDKQLKALAEVPFTERILQECKDTHILMAGFPLTILEIHRLVDGDLFFPPRDLSLDEVFAKKKRVGLGWHLISKTPIPESYLKTYTEQLPLLGQNEEVPKACEMVRAIILYYLITGEWLFDSCTRCQDVSPDGCHVSVVSGGSNGLLFDYWDTKDRFNGVGLASARKPSGS